MPRTALNDRKLKALEPLKGEATTRYWDAETTGLCAYVGKNATTFYAKAGGAMHKIGRWPEWTLFEARERCKEIRRLVAEGKDPRPTPVIPAMTLRKAFEMFEATRLARRSPATRKEYQAQFEAFIFPTWGDTPIDKIARREIVELHAEITARGTPTRANRVIAALSSLFGWLHQADIYKGENPAAKIERNAEEARETFLTPEQVAAVHSALDAFERRAKGNDVPADCVRLIIATGCRRSEAMGARWDQFDASISVWTKPASTTKQRKLHRVPLGPAAQVVLSRRRAIAPKRAVYVFPAGDGHIETLDTAWEFVRRTTGMTHVRLHDLRHSFASLAISAGVPLQVVGGLLGHHATQTTARYAHLYDEDLRKAVSKVAALVDGSK